MQGIIGSEEQISINTLQPGIHQIIYRITDNEGGQTVSDVEIRINGLPRVDDLILSHDVILSYETLEAEYIANDDMGIIDLPLSKSRIKAYQRMIVDQNTGKRAITEYKVIDKVGSRVALIALYPKTGRTHQLRVHLESINAPIVGDNKYRGLSEVYMSFQNMPTHNKLSQIKWRPKDIKNLQLHAYSIRMPANEVITAEVSEDFKHNLKFLGLKLPKKLHDIFY